MDVPAAESILNTATGLNAAIQPSLTASSSATTEASDDQSDTALPTSSQTTIFLFTTDLRLHDNPALRKAIRSSSKLLPVHIFDPREVARHLTYAPARHRTRFRFDAVADLRISLQSKGTDLILRTGHKEEVLLHLCETYNASSVFLLKNEFNRLHRKLHTALSNNGITMHSIPGNTLYEQEDLPFDVRSVPSARLVFLSKVKNIAIRNPLPSPGSIPPLPDLTITRGDIPTLAELGFDETYVIPQGLIYLEDMTGGETEALQRLSSLLTQLIDSPQRGDDHDEAFAFRINSWLNAGCISPRRIVHELRTVRSHDDVKKLRTFLKLLWCDFCVYRNMKRAARDHRERQRERVSSRKDTPRDRGPYRNFQRF